VKIIFKNQCVLNGKHIFVVFLRLFVITNFNTLTSRLIQAVRKKNSWIARGFVREYLHSCTGYGPGWSVKRRSKSCSLHSKTNFLVGGRIFCEWCHKWKTFWPP